MSLGLGCFSENNPHQIHLDKTKTTSSFRVFFGSLHHLQELGAFWRLLGGVGGRLPCRAFCQALLASQQAPTTPAIPAAPAERWREVGRKAAMTPVRPAKAQEALLRWWTMDGFGDDFSFWGRKNQGLKSCTWGSRGCWIIYKPRCGVLFWDFWWFQATTCSPTERAMKPWAVWQSPFVDVVLSSCTFRVKRDYGTVWFIVRSYTCFFGVIFYLLLWHITTQLPGENFWNLFGSKSLQSFSPGNSWLSY